MEARETGIANAVRAAMAWVEPEKSFPALMRLLDPMAGVVAMSVMVIEGETYRHLFDHPSGPADESIDSGTAPVAGTSLEVVCRNKAPVILRDEPGRRFERDADLFPRRGRAHAIVPIFDEPGREVIATFNVSFSTSTGCNESAVKLLMAVADWGALGIRNTILFEAERTAMRRLQEQDQLKSDLIAMVAHDLRAPLSVIMGSAETVEQRWDELDESTKRQLIGAVARSSRNLHAFVVESLHEAHMESAEFGYNIQPFDVGGVVQLAVEGLEREGVERIEVSIDEHLPQGRGDPVRHWQVLTNLLTNALKFSPPQARIELEVERVGGNIQVAVKDRGPGIHPDDMDKLFQRFSRLGHKMSGRSATAGGTGLGLYICKRVIEAQGGRIWVESAPGAGAGFYYTIPIAPLEGNV